MFDIMLMLFAFMVAIGILVAVHEFGHYWVAVQLNVKIVRFSIGFGKVIWARRFGRDQTEFALSVVPLGGYVQMVDEREGGVAEEDIPRAFNRQPLWVRSAIVVAGPAFNFIFAILAYLFMFMLGVTGMKAIVGEVQPQSLADLAGFRSGYEIVAVEQASVSRWQSVIQETLNHLLDDDKKVTYTVQTPQGREYDLMADFSAVSVDDVAQGQFFEKWGLMPFQLPLPAVIGGIVPDSPAAQAGLQVGDKVVSLDDQPVASWREWANYIAQRPEQTIIARIVRGEETVTITMIPRKVEGKGQMGVYTTAPTTIPEEYRSVEQHDIVTATGLAIEKTWDMSVLTLRLMAKMVMLEVSPKNISGPIGIAQYAGQSAQHGMITFIAFLALVSISLGVLNLLPIPMLDGGHLLLYAIEAVKGHPLNEQTQVWMQKIGLGLLMGLMLFAVFNDLERLFN